MSRWIGQQLVDLAPAAVENLFIASKPPSNTWLLLLRRRSRISTQMRSPTATVAGNLTRKVTT